MSKPGYKDPETLNRLFHEDERSLEEIGSRYGVTADTVEDWMERFYINTERRSGSNDSTLRLERTLGYLQICVNGEDRVYVHRLNGVAEFGYDAVVGSDVHHDNDNRMENRLDNLELMGRSDHTQHHNDIRHDIDDTSYREKGTLVWLYENLGMSAQEIADRYTVGVHAIYRWLHKYDIIDTNNTTATQPDAVDEDPQASLFDYATNEVAAD